MMVKRQHIFGNRCFVPRRDLYHQTVVNALQHDGWTITDDPLTLSYGGKDVYVDLGAERPIGAEKDGVRIAVEIKVFMSASAVNDLEVAVGQYAVYAAILGRVDPKRQLFLAVPEHAYVEMFEHPLGQLLTETQSLHLVVFEPAEERILRWKPRPLNK